MDANLLYRLQDLSDDLKYSLRSKGIVFPTRTANGVVKIGQYTVIKSINNFYAVIDCHNLKIVDNLSLLPSAILIANHLEITGYVDKDVLNADQNYGYAHFEEILYKRAINKNDFIKASKFQRSAEKKEEYKKCVLLKFEKLRNLG